MIRAGYDLMYIPSAIVWHAVSPLSNSENKVYYMERSKIRFALKNFDSFYFLPFFLISLVDTIFIILRDLKNRNFYRSKIRLRAIFWNLINLKNTLSTRKKHMSILEKNGTNLSYNKNLPLRSVKTK